MGAARIQLLEQADAAEVFPCAGFEVTPPAHLAKEGRASLQLRFDESLLLCKDGIVLPELLCVEFDVISHF